MEIIKPANYQITVQELSFQEIIKLTQLLQESYNIDSSEIPEVSWDTQGNPAENDLLFLTFRDIFEMSNNESPSSNNASDIFAHICNEQDCFDRLWLQAYSKCYGLTKESVRCMLLRTETHWVIKTDHQTILFETLMFEINPEAIKYLIEFK